MGLKFANYLDKCCEDLEDYPEASAPWNTAENNLIF